MISQTEGLKPRRVRGCDHDGGDGCTRCADRQQSPTRALTVEEEALLAGIRRDEAEGTPRERACATAVLALINRLRTEAA